MKKLPRITKICQICDVQFIVPIYSVQKFCSRSCYVVDWSERSKLFKKDFPKGNKPWNLGVKMKYKPQYSRRGIRVSKNTEFKYKNGSGWNVVLHNWVRKNLGRPNRCDFCKTEEKRMYHWANKSGKYKYDIGDWYRLCVPCHKKYDLGRIKNEKITS